MTSTRARPAPGSPLTAREFAILELVAAGATNPAIARQFGVGRDTVKTHLRRAYARLGATDRASAVHQAHLRGLLGRGRVLGVAS